MREFPLAFAPDGITPMSYGPCPVCGVFGAGKPPHGWDVPCPTAVAREDAYVAKLEAERAYFDRAGFMANDVGSAMRKMSGNDDDD